MLFSMKLRKLNYNVLSSTMQSMSRKAIYTREWRLKNPDKVKKYNKEKYERDKEFPERLLKKREMARGWVQDHKVEHRNYQRNWSREKLYQIKETIYEKLGHTCGRCGFADKRALCIDHVYGGGFKELRRLSVYQYYDKVIQDTEGMYQILCHNCNWIKRHENDENRKPEI